MFKEIEPKLVFEHFAKLNKVPRCSNQEEKVSNYLLNEFKRLGFACIQEECGNIIATKPATTGYENHGGVVLQAHMDMVCVKNDGSCHDFLVDEIKMKIEGDILTAVDTTLGADDGIGVAMILAIFEDDKIAHPRLETVITIAEETGMDGAIALDTSKLNADTLINIDSEWDDKLIVGCAGGADVQYSKDIQWIKADKELNSYHIMIRDIVGGHSGIDINKKGASAISLIPKVIDMLDAEQVDLFSISGGEKHNAIPTFSDFKIMTDLTLEEITSQLEDVQELCRREYFERDSKLNIICKEISKPEYVYDFDFSDKILSAIMLIPNGVIAMAQGIENLVETSSNLAIVKSDDTVVELSMSIRSSLESKKEEVISKMLLLGDLLDFYSEANTSYPAWEVAQKSKIRDIMIDVFNEQRGFSPSVESIHAGLECAYFTTTMKNTEMISIGPNIHNPHTTSEYMSISSAKKTYEFLVEVLKRL